MVLIFRAPTGDLLASGFELDHYDYLGTGSFNATRENETFPVKPYVQQKKGRFVATIPFGNSYKLVRWAYI
jgi:hypothetical protein